MVSVVVLEAGDHFLFHTDDCALTANIRLNDNLRIRTRTRRTTPEDEDEDEEDGHHAGSNDPSHDTTLPQQYVGQPLALVWNPFGPEP